MKEYSLKYHNLHFRSLADISFINHSQGSSRLDLIVCGLHLMYDLDRQDLLTVQQLIEDWREVVEGLP